MKNLILNEKELRKKMIDLDIKTIIGSKGWGIQTYNIRIHKREISAFSCIYPFM